MNSHSFTQTTRRWLIASVFIACLAIPAFASLLHMTNSSIVTNTEDKVAGFNVLRSGDNSNDTSAKDEGIMVTW